MSYYDLIMLMSMIVTVIVGVIMMSMIVSTR